MDITDALQRGYENALRPLGYHVYAAYSVPQGITYPFILIGTINATQMYIDRPFVEYEAFVTVDIVTGFPSPIGRSQALAISNQVESIINPDNGDAIPLPEPYLEARTFLQNSGTLESKANNYYIYRVLKTYRHLIAKR